MGVDRVGPEGPLSPSERKGRKSTPDSEEFREMMKTGKVGESEFEKPKKRRYFNEEELSRLPEPPQKTKPKETTPFQQPRINVTEGKEEISSVESRTEPQTEGPEKDKKIKDKDNEEEKKIKEKNKKEFEEVALYGKEEFKYEKHIKEEKGKIEKAQKSQEKIFIKEVPQKEEKKLKENIPPSKKEEEPSLILKEKKPSAKEKSKKEKEEFKYEISTVIQEMPSNIAAQTQALTSPLTPYLHPDIIPLFEKMVGTIIQMQAQGVTTTQVMLNSPAFTSSIFYGSSIILEKYSTAPDSFNIFLRGPQQAVVMFNENLEGLIDAFKRGNFNFKVGRLEAEHETLFKRKEKPKGKDTDTGATR